MEARLDDYKDLKHKLDGIVPPGHGFHRNLLFDALYSSLPRDPASEGADLQCGNCAGRLHKLALS